ncbi:hypothetical protein BDF22DRAFT_365695 [Syncephalis plumigaleata]|nr:hypothetical protein BDF22DRAFT_365695 [Syncephalis plumigaleata]
MDHSIAMASNNATTTANTTSSSNVAIGQNNETVPTNTTHPHSFNTSLPQPTASLMSPSQSFTSPSQMATPLGLRQLPVQSLQSQSALAGASPSQPNTATTPGHPLGSPLFTPPHQHARLPSEAASVASTTGGGNGPDRSSATPMSPTMTNNSVATGNSPVTATPFNLAAMMGQPNAAMLPPQMQQQFAQQLSNPNRVPDRMLQLALQMAGLSDRPLATLTADEKNKIMENLRRLLAMQSIQRPMGRPGLPANVNTGIFPNLVIPSGQPSALQSPPPNSAQSASGQSMVQPSQAQFSQFMQAVANENPKSPY